MELITINTNKVKLFQQLFDEVSETPNNKDWELRISLLREELQELKEAFDNKDYIEIADAYGDLLFLTIGGMFKHGIPVIEIVEGHYATKPLNIEEHSRVVDNISQWLLFLENKLQVESNKIGETYVKLFEVICDFALYHGIPRFGEIFEEICDSNLSKSDDTEQDALLTKQKYDGLGIETYYQEKFGKFITYRKEDGKILKSYKYTPVSLEKYFN